MKKLFYFLLLSLCISNVYGQSNATLDAYLVEAFANNLALKQKQFAVEKATAALQEARGLFLPTVAFNASYTLAAGGRRLEFPIGDLVNPVYSTLNQLTQSNNFPQVSNVNEQLAPNNFHETKIRTQMPLLNAEIYYNRKIKQENINFQGTDILIYKRELTKDFKIAYINYLQSLKAASVYEKVLNLLAENKKITETLVKNNMMHSSALLKIDAEIAKNSALLIEVKSNQIVATSYLNFLLNKPLETPIKVDTTFVEATSAGGNLAGREEFLKLKSGLAQNDLFLKMRKSAAMPTINAVLDLGFQGFYYKFDTKQRYGLLAFSLNWNIFAGSQNKYKIQQASIDKKSLDTQLQELENQLKLQQRQAQQRLEAARAKYGAAQTNINSLKEFFRLTALRYQAGQALQIEYLDALTQQTNAEIQQSIAFYEVLIKSIELERAEASAKF